MKIRIVSNGTPEGTKVFDDRGRQLHLPLLRVQWECSVNKPAVAVLTVADVEIQATGEVEALGNYDRALANYDPHEIREKGERFQDPKG